MKSRCVVDCVTVTIRIAWQIKAANMARYTGPKCRLCRREGVKLFLKGQKCESPKCPLFRKQQAPGQHGSSRRRPSEYSLQLREKQKVKRIYGVREAQFRRFFREVEEEENPGEALLVLLERRLDNTVTRSGMAHSRAQARQLITHRKVMVNGEVVDRPSFLVHVDDKISFAEGVDVLQEVEVPGWISLDGKKKEIKIVRLPERDDAEAGISEQLVFGFYSR